MLRFKESFEVSLDSCIHSFDQTAFILGPHLPLPPIIIIITHILNTSFVVLEYPSSRFKSAVTPLHASLFTFIRLSYRLCTGQPILRFVSQRSSAFAFAFDPFHTHPGLAIAHPIRLSSETHTHTKLSSWSRRQSSTTSSRSHPPPLKRSSRSEYLHLTSSETAR